MVIATRWTFPNLKSFTSGELGQFAGAGEVCPVNRWESSRLRAPSGGVPRGSPRPLGQLGNSRGFSLTFFAPPQPCWTTLLLTCWDSRRKQKRGPEKFTFFKSVPFSPAPWLYGALVPWARLWHFYSATPSSYGAERPGPASHRTATRTAVADRHGRRARRGATPTRLPRSAELCPLCEHAAQTRRCRFHG